MSQNPFSISFGRINEKIIEREQEIKPIFEDFDSESTRNTIYILTGPRGCGKTVTLGHIIDVYKDKKDWVVARLSQSDNMLEQMASLLYLNNLLEYFKKKGVHVLVAIDDVAKNKGMLDFIRVYQGFLIDQYHVRLLMTGLAKNVSKLETDRSLTLLFRAPKIQLSPLSIQAIAISYQNNFDISESESLRLAKTTKGYALAYQILDDILYKSIEKNLNSKVLKEFDLKLSEWSYEIIWSELTIKEKQILSIIADGFSSNKDLMEKLNDTSKGNLAIYKKKLAQEGLINVSVRGKCTFTLPRFAEFIHMRKQLIDD